MAGNEITKQASFERFNEAPALSRRSSAQSSRKQAHPQDVEGQIITVDPATYDPLNAEQVNEPPPEVESESPEVDILEARPQSVRSGRTTESQRAYIEMLEKMLLEERERRINVEKKLNDKESVN